MKARQLKHYFRLIYFEVKTLWICLLKCQKHSLLLYVYEINDNQIFTAHQSYFFYHKVSCSSLSARAHHLQQITNWTELLCGSLSSFSVSGSLHGSCKLSLLFSKAKYIAEFFNATPSLIQPWTPTPAAKKR